MRLLHGPFGSLQLLEFPVVIVCNHYVMTCVRRCHRRSFVRPSHGGGQSEILRNGDVMHGPSVSETLHYYVRS